MKDGTGLYKIEKRKNSAYPKHGGKHTSTVDKIKSVGKAIGDTFVEEFTMNKPGARGNRFHERISRNYKKRKKEYRDKDRSALPSKHAETKKKKLTVKDKLIAANNAIATTQGPFGPTNVFERYSNIKKRMRSGENVKPR